MDSEQPAMFVGAATLDAIALVEHFPHPDERLIADGVSYAGGGPAATAAVTVARLGLPAAFVGAVGDDAEGQRIVDELQAEGVDVSGVEFMPGKRSGASVIVVDRTLGTRAICTRPGPLPDLSRAAERVLSSPWVHVDHLGWAPIHDLLSAVVHQRPALSVDAGNPIPGFTAVGVDLYAPTLDALRRIHGSLDADQLLDAALAAGAATVVATDGSRGSFAATASGERVHGSALTVEVVSTLGAGDVFHGALVAAQLLDLALPEALAFAGVTAALSCRGLDGRSAIPDRVEVLAHLPSLAR